MAARKRLGDGQEQLKRRHQEGNSGTGLCAATSDLRDEVLLDLYDIALAELGLTGPKALGGKIALVPHGGFGRRDVAPFSDLDLMVLYGPRATDEVARLAERLFRDIVDAGLVLGHSVRTS